MFLKSIKPLFQVFLSLGLSILFTACAKNSETRQNEPAMPIAQAGGGIDGSGGETLQSADEQVKKVFLLVQQGLSEKLKLMRRHLKSDYFAYEYQYGKGSHALISEFLGAGNVQDKASLEKNVHDSLVAGSIIIEGILEDCLSAQGNRDGSAIGDLNQGKVCISLSRLRKIPEAVLEDQIFSLIIHELSHLVGFNEEKAVYLQKLINLHPGIYSRDNRDPYSPKRLPVCGGYNFGPYSKSMQNQNNYWIKIMDQIKDSLSGNMQSCKEYSISQSKMSIYMDDLEWLELTAKFSVSQEYKYGREAGIHFGMKEMAGFTNSLVLYVSNGEGGDLTLQAHVGTDAQCDPKVFLANILANMDEVWTLRCGDNMDKINLPERIQSRINKEKEILELDPDKEK